MRSSLWLLCIFLAARPALAGDSELADRFAGILSGAVTHGELWFAFTASAVGGFLTALTPCVYPLIPITIRYFGGMQQRTRAGLVGAAFMYVLGMTLLYAVLGTLFASLHWVFGSFLASSWVLGGVAIFCALMGLSMLGAFTLQLPPELSTRLSQIGGRGFGGAFAMGAVSGLIAAPCTGPVLAVILALVATSGQLLLGFGLMVAFGLGLGLPFLLLALLSGRLQRLPAGGVWMEIVKLVLAVAMFVVALYFALLALPTLQRLLRQVAVDWLGHAFVVAGAVAAALMLTSRRFAHEARLKALSVVLLSCGLGLLLFVPPESTPEAARDVPLITWQTDPEAALERARREHAPVMIDFTADWCQACKELERVTYVDVAVRREARRFVAVKLDATALDEAMQATFDRYGVLGLPTVVFVDAAGNVLSKPRLTGFVGAERFHEMMASVH